MIKLINTSPLKPDHLKELLKMRKEKGKELSKAEMGEMLERERATTQEEQDEKEEPEPKVRVMPMVEGYEDDL